jgi:hypothetical protein
MARQRYRLTPALQQEITAYIRAGGFPHVAAEAAGIPRPVFEHWLAQGQTPRGAPVYQEFARAVRQAHAQARLRAELAILSDKPLDWLKAGPGRETADSPGWTNPAKPTSSANGPENPLLDSEVQELLRICLQLLTPFPEARASLAAQVEHLRLRRPR